MSLSINLLLNIIVSKYLQHSKCLLILNSSQDLAVKNIPTVIHTFENVRNGTGEDFLFEKTYYKETERCDAFLFISENDPVELFQNYEEHLKKKPRVRFNNRRYIILLPDGFNVDDFASDALHYVANLLLIKCYRDEVETNAFLISDGYGNCSLFTHYYVGTEDVNEVYLLDSFDGSFKEGNDLFPDKISQQEGRIFKIGAADYLPYCFMETQRGSELYFTFELSRRLNMTPMIVSELNETWGEIYRNWTGVGILGKLVMDEHDISLGALFNLPERIIFSDFTQVTTYSRVTCLVPKPTIVEGWLMPITLFAVNIWLAFAVTYAAIIAVDYLTKLVTSHGPLWYRHKRAIHGTVFNVFTTFILQGQPEFTVPKETYRRILHLTNLIGSLIFGVLYSTRLSSSMIVPAYENDINTAQELADSKIDWGELWIDWVLPLQIDDTSVAVKLSKKFQHGTEQELRAHSLKNNFAFGMERLPSGFFAIGEYIQDDIIQNYKVMKEDLYCQYAAMQLRKNSVLLDVINRYILLSAQSGLFTYWESDASIYHSNMNIQMGIIYPYTEPTLISLKFAHVKGSFGILFVGIFISCLAFLCERFHLFEFIL